MYKFSLFLILLCLVFSKSLSAIEKQGEAGFVIINDGFFASDQFFTSGNSLYYTFAETPLRISAHIDIYTPRREDLYLLAPPKGVHPYGGYMYGEAIYKNALENFVFAYTLRIGTTGKSALAKEFQDWWHRIIGRPLYQGWDSQIGTTIGVLGAVEALYKFEYEKFILAPVVVITLSNILSTQSIGLRLIGGHHFDREMVYLEKKSGFTFTYHTDILLQHVDYNVFLSGFENYAYGVTPLPFIAELIIGFDFRWGDFGINNEYHFKTTTYTTQEWGHNYGKAVFYWRF